MIWTKRRFELGAERLRAQCEERKKERLLSKEKRSIVLNADELRYLSQLHSVADGMPIDKNSDIEVYLMCRSKCHHVIITSENELYKDGWLVNSVPSPDTIHHVSQHEELTYEAIQALYKRFERNKKSFNKDC